MSSLRIKDDLNFFFFHWFEYYEFKCTRNPYPSKHVVVYSRVKENQLELLQILRKKKKKKRQLKRAGLKKHKNYVGLEKDHD